MSADSPKLEARAVGKNFGSLRAVSDVSMKVAQGELRENDDVAVTVESRRRQGLRLHHTGTHLLHAALRTL